MKTTFEIKNKQTDKVVMTYNQEWEARLNADHSLEYVNKKTEYEVGDKFDFEGRVLTVRDITLKRVIFNNGLILHKVNL